MYKDKNFFCFPTTNGKEYRYNFNTGELHGLSGKIISSIPPEVRKQLLTGRSAEDKYIRGTSDLMLEAIVGWRATDLKLRNPRLVLSLTLIDKLASANCQTRSYYHAFEYVETGVLTYCDKHFSAFLKYLNENPSHTAASFEKANRLKNLHLEDFHFTTEEQNFIYAQSIASYTSDKVMKAAFKWCKEGAVYAKVPNYVFAEYIHLCENLDAPIAKKNLLVHYKELAQVAELKRQELLNKRIEKNQSAFKDKLLFSNDTFETVIPLTLEEFIEEGANQHNCVGRLYTEPVANGDTHIVFIRKKNNLNHSFVTCEVSRSGYIRQFLGFGNSQVKDIEAIAFEQEYQRFLMSQEW